MGKVKASKLSGRKRIPPRVVFCSQKHQIYRALVSPVIGRKRLIWTCECVYKPIEK